MFRLNVWMIIYKGSPVTLSSDNMDLLKKIRKELNVILREVKSQIIDVHIARRDIMWTIKVNDPVWQKTIADNIKKCEGVNMTEYWANV